jgi:Tfp pilus assembly protein PilV
MPTFADISAAARRLLCASRLTATVEGLGRASRRGRGRLAQTTEGSGEAGMTLIEVMISALLVGIIAIGTLTAFDTAGRATADERAQSQAAVIAAQDEEELRSLKATKLGQFGTSSETTSDSGQCIEEVASAWRYCEGHLAYKGTIFTVTSKAEYVSASQESLTCNASPASADYIKTTSEVTWKGGRTPVTQSSIVTSPTKAALLVKVVDQYNEPVEGALVKVTGTSTSAQQTTPAAGCVVFGALADKTVTINVSKATYVDHQGASPPPSKTATVSSSSLTEVSFTIGTPGSIVAEFESNGTTGLSGETFMVSQTGVAAPSNFLAGSNGTLAQKPSISGLFPFATPGKPPTANPYTAFAGDCEKNNPETATVGVVKAKTAQVNPGASTSVKLELPAINLTVMSGTKSGSSTEGTPVTSTSAKLINSECSGQTARNAASINVEHPVSVVAGKLEPKFWPYAKVLELCVAFKESTKYYKNKTTIQNTAKAGSPTATFYVKGTGVTGGTTTVQTCP